LKLRNPVQSRVATLLHLCGKAHAMKPLAILFVALLAISCQDNKDDKDDKAKEGPNTTNVENVEGSLPDTTAGTTINEPDTARRDSL